MIDWIDLEAFKKESEKRIKAPLAFDLLYCEEVEKSAFPKIDVKAHLARLQKEIELAVNKTWADYSEQLQMVTWDLPKTDAWTDLSEAVVKATTISKYGPKDKWWIQESDPNSMMPCPIPNCGCGAPPPKLPKDLLQAKLPGLNTPLPCPEPTGETCDKKFRVWGTVIHLNDGHKWSRDKIADWLESLDIDLTFPTTEEES